VAVVVVVTVAVAAAVVSVAVVVVVALLCQHFAAFLHVYRLSSAVYPKEGARLIDTEASRSGRFAHYEIYIYTALGHIAGAGGYFVGAWDTPDVFWGNYKACCEFGRLC